MATLALQRTWGLRLPFLQTPFLRPLLFGALTPSLLVPTPSWSLRSLLDLLPPFLLAVPKKKVSHSRKAMRSANKGLKDKHNIVSCPGCGSPKLAHHLCSNCYSFLNRMWKARSKTNVASIPEIS